ncbi:restriction endonuclease [Mycobacterium sp. SMC-8]|uniref:restriction endonuclease n=1 Tax=Mycobacterium sp. SMC-8 TaxID=2857060 RepID=UPI0021B2B706|nr:restriction endonuclease [Mycobacterium sp. SMC-8]UXA12374.1 restriction endonuclease [Mycobacterium sp. SMC-8]
MGIPDFQSLMRPVLVAIQGDEPKSHAQIRDTVAAALNISDEDRQVMLPSGKQELFTNRVAWAITHMAQAQLLLRPERGRHLLSERGKQVLLEHPDRVDLHVLAQFPEWQEFRNRSKSEKQEKSDDNVIESELSPSEAVGALVEASYDALAAELLDRILAQPPIFLETLSLKLLRAMGYGGRESLLEHTGKPGDSGLDGIVRQDALGLDLVGVQAKRYDKDNTVSRPDIQAFVGALQGAQTSRGVFVTTGRFSPGAKQFAENVAMRLRLIDGKELTKLMVRYNVGVQVRETFELKQIDEETFEE